jgi:ABC-2 type transport system permease protein/lipopolysaccharide transport system permease protein
LVREAHGPSAQLARAVADLCDGLARWELWGTLGWHDLRQKYRRSTIGPFWLTLSMGIFAGAIGTLYAGIFDLPLHDYLPFLTVGLIVWAFISTNILEGCQVFVVSEGFIKQARAPLSVHVFRMLWRNLIVLGHNMVIYLIVVLAFGVSPGAAVLFAVPGLILLTIAGFCSGLLLGLLCARFRDLPLIVANAVQIIFMITPIMWKVDQLAGNRRWVAQLNPCNYLIEIVRGPLLGAIPPLTTWLIVILVIALGCALSFGFFVRFRARIAYWL